MTVTEGGVMDCSGIWKTTSSCKIKPNTNKITQKYVINNTKNLYLDLCRGTHFTVRNKDMLSITSRICTLI